MDKHRVAASTDFRPGTVIRDGPAAVGNNGELFGVGRKCRHLRADLGEGSIDDDGCLVCPWHQAKYDVKTGQMVRGPQGIFAKVPGLGLMFKTLTAVLPLKRYTVTEESGDIYIA